MAVSGGTRTRKAAKAAPAAPEPEETQAERSERGPTALAVAHTRWLNKTFPGINITAEQVWRAQSTRKEFRNSDDYVAAVEEMDNAKGAKEAERERRATLREARAAETPAEEEVPTPRKRAGKKADPIQEAAQDAARPRRGRKTTPTTTEAPEEAPAGRRPRASKRAATAPTAAKREAAF